VPIKSQPGQALIQDGWKQFGTVTLASQKNYAYRSLWEGTLDMLLWFLVGSALAAVAGTFFVRVITRPLLAVVDQAQAIADRRFLTIAEPRTPELRSVVRAMNAMVERVKAMFASEAERLESLRRKINRDELTGLSSREYFMSHLKEALTGDQFGSSGSLVMVRLSDLNELNRALGRQQADALLKAVGKTLFDSGNGKPGQRAGRLKGAEFGVLCPTETSPQAAAEDIHRRLMQEVLPGWQEKVPELFTVSAVRYERGQGMGPLLSGADEALARASSEGPNAWHAAEDAGGRTPIPAERWRELLGAAVEGGRAGELTLAYYPVLGTGPGPGKPAPARPITGPVVGGGPVEVAPGSPGRQAADAPRLLHREGMIRLKVADEGRTLSAGDFLPMAAQLNLNSPLDLRAVRMAIDELPRMEGDLAVNLSAEALADFGFRQSLAQLLKAQPAAGTRLLFEVPEYGVFRHLDAFRDLAQKLKAAGARIGIEYFGQKFAEAGKLADLGLDYIKVHPTYVRGIGANPGNQEYLRGLCKVAHDLGITVVALGVESMDDLPLLASLGFDGVTGPGVA
jgi:diguanylate cyclase (GGDEF)-like protein